MTLFLKTLNRGQIDAGFWSVNVSMICLGDCPLMGIGQFVDFAGTVLTEHIIPKVAIGERARWGHMVRQLHERVLALPVYSDTQRQSFAASNAGLVMIEHRDSNPFTADARGREVSVIDKGAVHYVIEAEEFFLFAVHILRGGSFGWDAGGVFAEVKNAVIRLDAALNG